MTPVEEFINLLREKATVVVDIDKPSDEIEGTWWLDIMFRVNMVTVSWNAERGFGLFTGEDEGFGTKPDEIHLDAPTAVARVLELVR